MARRSIGTLVAEMILRDEKFRSKINATAKLIDRRVKDMRTGFNNLAKSTALAGVAAGAGLAAGVAKGISSIDRLAKQSDRLNIPIEQLAAMRHAATLAGVEVDVLEKAMVKLNRSAFDAAGGSKEQAKAFERLGINVEEFVKLRADEQMALLADRLQLLGNANERAAITMELLGKGGSEMGKLLAGGSKAIEEATREAELFGLTVNRIDATKVELAADAISRVKAAGAGFFDQLAVQFAPLVAELGEKVVLLVEHFGGMEKIAERAFTGMAEGAKVVTDVIDGLNLSLQATKFAINELSAVFATPAAAIADTATEIANKFIDTANNIVTDLEKGRNFLQGLAGQEKDSLPRIPLIERRLGEEAIARYVALATEAETEILKIIDRGLTSDRIDAAVASVGEKWDNAAKEIAKAAEDAALRAVSLPDADPGDPGMAGDAIAAWDESLEMGSRSVEKLGKAAEEAAAVMMGLEQVEALGGRSQNARFATKALDFYSRADEAEARGQFSVADDLRRQALDAEGKVRRRAFSEEGEVIEGRGAAGARDVAKGGGEEASTLKQILEILQGMSKALAVA